MYGHVNIMFISITIVNTTTFQRETTTGNQTRNSRDKWIRTKEKNKAVTNFNKKD